MYRFITTMMIFALALGFQSAHAAPPENVPSVVVHFADLDLSRSEGATVLYRRLKGAAETVCAPLDGGDLARHMSFKACVQNAISTAVAKVDQPALSAYHEAKTNGRRNATIQTAQTQSR
jgi:UrcA family protein